MIEIYDEKQNLNTDPSIAETNKVTDSDMNKLRTAVLKGVYYDNTNENLIGQNGGQLNPKNSRYERKVLWTNSTPSQNMGANVTINLSSDDYDELEWIFAYSTTANNGLSVNCLKGQNVHVTTLGYSSPSTVRRTVNYVSDTQYSTNAAKYNDGDSSNMLIPLKVIGIKNSEA